MDDNCCRICMSTDKSELLPLKFKNERENRVETLTEMILFCFALEVSSRFILFFLGINC